MKTIKLLFTFIFFYLFAMQCLWAQIIIMPLGDSITRGNHSTDVNGYRRDLKDLLVSSGYNVNFVGTQENGTFVDNQHEGHSGWRDEEIGQNVDYFLNTNPAKIILLHIGTNDISLDPLPYTDPTDVEDILNRIDVWESQNNRTAIVVLAKIINRQGHVCPASSTTTTFNDNVRAMAESRINDRIVFVDMECSAAINYTTDLDDYVHPNDNGYEKMAVKWFDALLRILPQADAGPDRNVEERTLVLLDGSGSFDPDGTYLQYMWSQLSQGSIVTLSDPTLKKPTFTAPGVGLGGERLEFKLNVKDSDGFEHSDTVFVDVGNVIIAPVADAGPDQMLSEGGTVTLNGSNSHDPDGTISFVQWKQVPGGTQVILTTPNDLITEFEAPEVGTEDEVLTFKLTVTDNDDQLSDDSVTIVVKPKEAPIADAGPDLVVAENKIITLDGSYSSDPNNPGGTFSSVHWEQISGQNQVILATPEELTTDFTTPEVDSGGDILTFKLTVIDKESLTSSDTVTVTVKNVEGPAADAGGDQIVDAGFLVKLDGSNSSDPDGTITVVQWQQVAGQNQVTLTMPNDLTTEFMAPAVDSDGDTLTFKLMIKDDNNLLSEDTVNVTIRPTTISPANSASSGSGGGGCFIQTASE